MSIIKKSSELRTLSAWTPFLVFLTCGFLFVGCGTKNEIATPISAARAVTADIQAGIERHIEEESAKNGGFYKIKFGEKELNLKLVRVHVEYLAALGPELNFACVDLADTDGEVYDVDFFLKGPIGDMKVTQTTVHKTNGQPLYAWKQNDDKTWHQIPVDEADNALLGVIEDRDEFEFVYTINLPEFAGDAKMWLPLPITDNFQTIKKTTINVPGKQTILHDTAHNNKILLVELTGDDGGKTAEMRFTVERIEKSAYAEEMPDKSVFLRPERLVPFREEFKTLGEEAVAGKEGELVRARALYDHVIDRMAYKKVGDEYGKGDAVYACDARTGNCTDFHSYFIAVARTLEIPARFAIGASIPSSRNEGGIGGYHCWAEFYAEGKWWPVDISEGDKYTALSTYYFGHHPANRIELSRGRDLEVDPAPASGPINFLAYPLLEVNGKIKKIKPKFSFIRLTNL